MANHIGPYHSSPSSSPPPQGALTNIFLLNQGRDKVEEGVGKVLLQLHPAGVNSVGVQAAAAQWMFLVSRI